MKKAKAFRKLYAELVLANGNVTSENSRLLKAFTSVRREDFVGNGPWYINTPGGYVKTPSNHPELLYQNILIALDKENGINNGLPSLHALCIDALDIKRGETIAHVGAGTGYYTAILAQLVGKSGQVLAYEIEPKLSKSATTNLASYSNVKLEQESGANDEFPDVDIIYVNAGVTHPANSWLDNLRIDGRILFPLTGEKHRGWMVRLHKLSADYFSVKIVSNAIFIPCIGLRDAELAVVLDKAVEEAIANRPSVRSVKSLRRNSKPDETCYLSTDDWWLSTAEVT